MKRKQRFFWKNLGLGILILALAVSFFHPAPAQAQVDNGTWVVKTPSASGATNFTVADAAGMIYQIGSVGSSANGVPFADAYDPLTDTWTSTASMPTTLASYGAATVNGIIYVFGNDLNNGVFYVYQYDPSNNAWTSAGQINEPRSGFSAVAGSDGMIYIIGGVDSFGSYIPTVRVYDPATNAFVPNLQLPMLYGLSDFGATLGVNGNIYVVGGTSGSADSANFLEFNPVTYTWVDLSTPLPVAKRFVKAAVLGGKIYAVGGTTNGQVTRDVYEYDPQAASPAWVVRTSLLDTPETNANVISGLTSANGHLYAMGGGYNQEFTIGLEAQVIAVPSLTDVYVGDPLTVDLIVQNATELYAMQATCTVDPAVLTLPDGAGAGVFGTLFDPADFLVGSNNADPLAGTWTGAISQHSPAPPVTGGGTMATIPLTAAAPGSTTFNCTPLLSDQDGFTEPFTFTGTTITVQALTIVVNGTASYQGRLDHTGIQVTLTLSGNLEGTAVTDNLGAFRFTLNTAGSYTIRAEAASYLPNCDTLDLSGGQVLDLLPTTLLGGDTNGDQTIDIGDATLLAANFGLGVPPAPTEVDINADTLVNVQDLAILGGNYGLTGCQSW